MGSVRREVRGEAVVLAEVVGRAVKLVGAGLGDDVDEAAARPSEFRVGAVRHDDEVLHRVEIEREGRPLAAALLAEEGVVEVGAVHRDVVVDAALAAHADLVAVGALHDGHVRRESGVVEDVASVVRQSLDRLHAQPGRALRLGHVHRRRLGGRRHLLELHRLGRQREGQVDRLTEAQGHVGPLGRLEAECAGRHRVGTDAQQCRDEDASLVGREHPLGVGLRIAERDGGARKRIAGGVRDDAADDAGGRLRLGLQGAGDGEERGEKGKAE